MAGYIARAIIAAALVITWSLPASRLAVVPSERALALAADAICWAEGSAALASLGTPASGSRATGAGPDPRLVEVAALFEPAAKRQWAADLARVAFVLLAVAALLARWSLAPLLVIAAAILYLASYSANWDAYRLALVTQSPRLWWLAISQWSLALWSERLAAPVAVWLSLLGASVLLLATVRRRLQHALHHHRSRLHPRWPSPTQPTL
jgi:hypothetical protein